MPYDIVKLQMKQLYGFAISQEVKHMGFWDWSRPAQFGEDMFDFNHDGRIDSIEEAAEYTAFMESMKSGRKSDDDDDDDFFGIDMDDDF